MGQPKFILLGFNFIPERETVLSDRAQSGESNGGLTGQNDSRLQKYLHFKSLHFSSFTKSSQDGCNRCICF